MPAFVRTGRWLLPFILAATLFISIQPVAGVVEGEPSFTTAQLRHPRVAMARREKDTLLRRLSREHAVAYPPKRLFIRVYKSERELELWVGHGSEHILLKTYPVCAASGNLGPKRSEGDRQVPEGCYLVTRFNPYSLFHLSLGISYPNASDRRFADRHHPGGDIYIHGNCVSVGCIAVTDEGIKEIYWLAVLARSRGGSNIPVHIFPCRMDEAGMESLKEKYSDQADLLAFWDSLKPIHDAFELTGRVPSWSLDRSGYYTLTR